MADDTAATPPPEPTAPADPPPVVAASATTAPDLVTARLLEHGVGLDIIAKIKDELGVTTVDDLATLAEKDLLEVGMKVVPARKLVAAFAPVAPVPDTAALGAAAFDILPSVPDDASWLSALRTGGVLKVDQSTVISAIRAALAYQVGLYEIPGKLVALMEKFADTNEEQVDPAIYFPLREQLTRRSYGDIFSAIPGLTGNYVTEGRKKELLKRIDNLLWPAIQDFSNQLKAWQEAWMQGVANPAVLMASLLSGGAGGMALPPGMMQPPETGVLRDHASAVNDAVNRIFAGTGAQIAAALAYEAVEIKKSLENPRLPALVGAPNREQMLKLLGANVSATYPRLETNLTRYVLGLMQADDQPAGNEELQYFGALQMLGAQIDWAQLSGGGRKISGIGGSRL